MLSKAILKHHILYALSERYRDAWLRLRLQLLTEVYNEEMLYTRPDAKQVEVKVLQFSN